MEKLLKWSLDASAHDANSGKPAPQPNPELLAQLFGAKDEATMMKEAVEAATNTEAALTDRETALDNLEMLVENLDNANNLENMKLWPAVIGLCNDPQPEIRKFACWIIGTAVQNNPKSQAAFLKQTDGFSLLLKLAESDSDSEVSVKAIYALSSALQHCPEAYTTFEASHGWKTLAKLITTPASDKLQLRALSLVHSVAHIEPAADKFDKLRSLSILDNLVSILESSVASDSASTAEKALHILSALQQEGCIFTDAEKKQVVSSRSKLVASNTIPSDEFLFHE